MFIFRSEKEEIARLKEEISRERVQLGMSTQELLPQAKKAAAMGSAVFAIKRFAPLLRPVIFAVAQRGLRKGTGKGLFKIAALGAAAFGAYKLLGSDDGE